MNRTLLKLTLGLALWTSVVVHAQTTAITYQGNLNENGVPANASYDFQFKVFNNGSAGTQISSTLTKGGIAVSNGLFNVTLDFGAPVFDGSDRWLAISVRPGDSTNAYTNLVPRQKFSSVPYAIRAANFSGTVNASQINGVLSSNNFGAGTITSLMLAPGSAAANLAASGQSAVPSGGIVLSTNANDGTLAAAGFTKLGVTTLNDTWQRRTGGMPPSPRRYHTALWTGQEMLVWGGDAVFPEHELNTGARYDPATDTWTPISTNGAPTVRAYHTAVWTGTEMIVWGGVGGWAYQYPGGEFTNIVDGGGRYNPTTDTWAPISTNGAPPPSTVFHTAVWTGTEMIIWGGQTNASHDPVRIGARYNPITDAWTSISTNGAPTARIHHGAIWTGNEMLVFGGEGLPDDNYLSIRYDGGRYDPVTDTWSFLNGPWEGTKRTVVWTGTELITFGGYYQGRSPPYFEGPRRFNPTNDLSSELSFLGRPNGRYEHTAVWTGSDMIIWGGRGESIPAFDSGGLFNTFRGDWTPITTAAAPKTRWGHTAVWTGREMLVFGGDVTPADEGAGGVSDETWSYTPRRTMHLYQKP